MEIIKIGSNGIHDGNFKVKRPAGYSYYLFLLVKTPAIFIINGEKFTVESNSVILYEPGFPHYYSAKGDSYINDWIHFKAEEGTDYFKSLSLPLNTVTKIYDDTFISEMIRLMSNEYYSMNTNKAETMNLLLQTMFVKLNEVIYNPSLKKNINLHYGELIILRREIHSNPQFPWTVEKLAERLNVSNAHLQQIYRLTFGISCIADVIECRMNYAKDILSKTNVPIRQVAYECGYNNDVHFMRQFKKNIGVTPSEYRRVHSFRQDAPSCGI